MRRWSPLLTLPLLAQAPLGWAQGQSTFYAAFEDGRELEGKGQWRAALEAYRRAVALRPASADQVVIYGNNLLRNYHPYTRMARCHLELGELEAAEAQLARAQAQREPEKEREALRHRAEGARPPKAPSPAPESPKRAPEPAPVKAPEAAPIPPPPQVAPEAPPAEPKPAPSGRTEAAPRPSRTPGSVPSAPMAAAAAEGSAPSPAPTPQPARGGWPWWLLLLLPAGAWLWRRRAAPQSAESFAEPERIGPYRVERLLGRGGFASTYLARHEASGQRVALKRLHPHRQDDPEFLGRFHQEAKLGARLRHPHLVPLVDPGPSSGPRWLAMEYVEGQRLDARLKSEGALPLDEALGLARDIASALAYAHGEGVVHRDLKPANVILSAEGVKVMDFGIARVMDAETLTTTYAFLGTPRYAAPEAQTKTAIGPAADWYSFGIMLFEMLAGRIPFQGETPFEILDRHRAEPLPDLRALRPEVPEPLAALVNDLCAKAPDQRPEDAEVLRRLDGLSA